MEAAFLRNAPSEASFQGAIDEQNQRGIRSQKGHHQESEQNATQMERGPHCPVENAMEGGGYSLSRRWIIHPSLLLT